MEKNASEVIDIGGIGGCVPVRFVTIPMKIDQHQFDCKIAWAQTERVPFLLGRENVFDFFDVTFQQRNKMIIFKWQK